MFKSSAWFLLAALLVVPAMRVPAQDSPGQPAAAPMLAPVASPLKADIFTRGVYWPWERTAWPAQNAGMDIWQFSDKILGDLKNRYYCDVVWVVNIGNADAVRLAGLAQKYDIAVLPVANAMYEWRDVRTENAARKAAQATVTALGGMPGIAGYVLLDEPRRGEVDHLEHIREALTELDPSRPAIAVSMLRQTEAVARRTNLPFLVSDPYSYFGPGSPNGPNTPAQSRDYYLTATHRTVDMARETGKTPWIMPQIFNEVWGDWHYDAQMNVVAEPGSSHHWRMPTLGETRWQIWQAIAAGARGVVFYVLFPTVNPRSNAQDAKDMKGYRVQKPLPGMPLFDAERPLNEGTAILHNDGSPTPQARVMGAVFAALEPHRELLGRLQPTVPLAFADAPFRASTFRHPASGQTVVVVVNDDTDAAVTGKVRFLPSIQSAHDLIGNSAIKAQAGADLALPELSLKIEAGAGKLLVLEGEVGAAQTYVEDFAIQLSAGKFEHIEKVLLSVDWGMGYRVAVKTQKNPQSNEMGQLQYSLSSVAGDRKRMGGRLYLVYSGARQEEKPSVEVAVSADGKEFQRISVDEFEQPIAIPQNAAHLRFTLLNADATLNEWRLITVP